MYMSRVRPLLSEKRLYVLARLHDDMIVSHVGYILQ